MPAGEGGFCVYYYCLLLYQIYIAPLSCVHTFKSALNKIYLIKTYTDTLKHTITNEIDISIYIFKNKTVN